MKFIHCSDLHIDSPLLGLERYDGAPVESMRAATRQAMRNIVAVAIENAVDFVVIAGDVFDGNWRDFNTGLFFNSQIAKLGESKIPVVVLKGNHDAESEITKSLRTPSNVTILSHRKPQTVRLENIGVAIHGQSFPDRAVPVDLAANYPAGSKDFFNVGLLHTSLTGHPPHEPYAPTTLDVLRSKGYAYWGLGHVHKRQIVCEAPRVVYCGNSQGRGARELGPKGCDLVTLEDGEITNEFLAIDAVRWTSIEIDIRGLQDLDALMDAARVKVLEEVRRASGRVLAARLSLTGTGKVHSELVRDPDKAINELRNMAMEASDGSAWIERVRRDTRPAYDRNAVSSRDDPVGEVVRLCTRLEQEPQELQGFSRNAFGPLLDRLPADLRQEISLADPEALKAILRDAEAQVLDVLGGGAK